MFSLFKRSRKAVVIPPQTGRVYVPFNPNPPKIQGRGRPYVLNEEQREARKHARSIAARLARLELGSTTHPSYQELMKHHRRRLYLEIDTRNARGEKNLLP